jgi:adenine-specific DNA-methyltransferase
MAKTKYENYSKEQLISKLERLEKKGYGLVWEDKPEKIADRCEKELPVLVEDKNREIKKDPNKPTHFIFEGDNYHTLYTLNFTHKKGIDLIYIDPLWRYLSLLLPTLLFSTRKFHLTLLLFQILNESIE